MTDKRSVNDSQQTEEVSQYTMIYLSDGMDKASSFQLNELWVDGDKVHLGSYEAMTVFGIMWFGYTLLERDEELFYYRTGITLKLWGKGVGKGIF